MCLILYFFVVMWFASGGADDGPIPRRRTAAAAAAATVYWVWSNAGNACHAMPVNCCTLFAICLRLLSLLHVITSAVQGATGCFCMICCVQRPAC